ncbi:hypothetical protein Cni_G15503 [Canna indica]|uniref:Uncharacterized protein n=1 Tax=Canna indica TaxID=4628 RepID=A0AAQ3KEK4_9LILI|nr:hypothetical protein Cni_G15503 [Canna indica]
MRKAPLYLLLTLVFLVIATGWFSPPIVGARQLAVASKTYPAVRDPNKPVFSAPPGDPYTRTCRGNSYGRPCTSPPLTPP